MKRSVIVLLHIGYWAVYLLLIIILLGVYSKSGSNASDPVSRISNAFYSLFLFAFFPSLIAFYLFYFVLFPKYLQQNKVLLSIIYGLLISIGAAIIGYVLIRYFIESGRLIDMDEGGKGRSTAIRTIVVMTLISSISGIMALVIKGFITWYNEIKLKELLKEKNHEMEMALIKSQLDPHLLFNTINNIDALILKDGVEASNYLNKLSDIMRFMLYETKPDVILLSKEIEYIEKYISLQKIRTANTNYVNFSIVGDVGSKQIAPMLFIPFIENAFKHTNNKKFDNAITIEIIIRTDDIQLLCKNRFDSKLTVKRSSGGLGNELIQKRLNLMYAGNHTLVVHKNDELYSVDLTITNG
ncbi:MAG: sensor histidine kinase [Flammeovirgaceae bacterium]|nr:sensor histidine kinase [Flammeovirgaceae bacterium]